MPKKPRFLYVKGVKYTVEVEEFRSGDGEGSTFGYIEDTERRIVVDKYHQDDSTLAHEVGHAVAYNSGVYMSEDKMLVFEDFFAMCRDPRNAWFVEYLKGDDES